MKKAIQIVLAIMIVFIVFTFVNINNTLPQLHNRIYDIVTPTQRYDTYGPIYHRNHTYQFLWNGQITIISDNDVSIRFNPK